MNSSITLNTVHSRSMHSSSASLDLKTISSLKISRSTFSTHSSLNPPASCTMGTGSFPGVKSGRDVTLTPHPLLVPWSRKSRAIPLLLLWAIRPVQSLSACTRVHLSIHTLKSSAHQHLHGSWWKVYFIKNLVIHFSSASCHSILLPAILINIYGGPR
jgi:hypothetical protein